MTEHTPGPCELCGADIAAGDECRSLMHMCDLPEAESTERARLIAAAPAMLAALYDARHAIRLLHDAMDAGDISEPHNAEGHAAVDATTDALDKLNDAINAAEGHAHD